MNRLVPSVMAIAIIAIGIFVISTAGQYQDPAIVNIIFGFFAILVGCFILYNLYFRRFRS